MNCANTASNNCGSQSLRVVDETHHRGDVGYVRTTSLLMLKSTFQSSGGSFSDCARRLGEHYMSDHACVSWEVNTGDRKSVSCCVVSEGSNLSLRDGVVVITSHVVANCWLTINVDDDLWLGLISSEPLERNGFVEDVVTIRDSSVLAESDIITSKSSGVR
jgi:hypothetical protein